MRDWLRREAPAMKQGALCATIALATMVVCVWGW
ncbi:hypothetical protein J2X37_000633 [Croceicoccus sp. BE223]|nr:hypothetical protein [Croceicoccus sp. BE223]